MNMTCISCHENVLECKCPDAIARLKWLISPESPMAFSKDQLDVYKRRITELEGYAELHNVGKDKV